MTKKNPKIEYVAPLPPPTVHYITREEKPF